MTKHTCKTCGVEFTARSYKQVTCSEMCRFLMYQNKGDQDSCWNWSGPKTVQGYGVLFLDAAQGASKRTTAHRYAFMLSRGALPDAGLCVMHACDNPSCTNPSHLKVGSRADNNADRSAKGRSGSRTYTRAEKDRYSILNRGEKNTAAILTEDSARAIKYKHPELTGAQVGRLYGVTKSTANLVRRGATWAYL